MYGEMMVIQTPSERQLLMKYMSRAQNRLEADLVVEQTTGIVHILHRFRPCLRRLTGILLFLISYDVLVS